MEIRLSRVLLILAIGSLLWISKDYLWQKGTDIANSFPETTQNEGTLSEYSSGR